MVSKPQGDLVGRVIAGKIRIESLIGRGAMGAVYVGLHLTLEERVAVKVMHAELAVDPSFPERFRREATTMVRLKHPGTVRVLDFGEEPDGLLYLVMELIEGRSLGAIIAAEWPLAPVRTANLLRQVLAAVQAAHTEDIIHRDLKPENILVVRGINEDGEPIETTKVCDFGIAKIRDARSERKPGERPRALTTAGIVVGTPEYMSPEQGRAEVLDARSDVYSIGVVLYEILTRAVPFEADSAVAVVLRHIGDEPEPPSKRVPDVNRTLEAICLRALRKSPDDRFQSAREMRAALREVDPAPYERPIPPSIQSPKTSHTETSLQFDVNAVAAAPSVTPSTITQISPLTTRSRRAPPWALVAAVALVAAGGGFALRYEGRRESVLHASAILPASVELPPTATRSDAPPPPSVPPPSSAPAPSLTLARIDAPVQTAVSPPVSPAKASGVPTSTAPPVASSESSIPDPPPTATVVATAPPVAPPPVTVTPTAATPTAAPTPVAPPPPAFDLSTARASIAGVGSTEGVLKSAVASALSRTTGAMTACYRSQLATSTTPVSGTASLHLETDGSGNVVRATASVPFAPSIARCVEGAALGVRFTGVDTGDARADVALRFEVN